MNICVRPKDQKRGTAGFKAPSDVCQICGSMGMEMFDLPILPQNLTGVKIKLWLLLVLPYYWEKLYRKAKRDDILVLEYPSSGIRVAYYFIRKIKRRKGSRFIAVVHDLDSLRKGLTGEDASRYDIGDRKLLKEMDKVISHNQHMTEYLVSLGLPRENLINLEVFDYLCAGDLQTDRDMDYPSVTVAGYLSPEKSNYVYQLSGLKQDTYRIHLYGMAYSGPQDDEHVIYHGAYPPEELPSVLTGSFGLVWDGDSIDTCSGNTGVYLRHNNPHKTSLYLASGIPVIIWEEAAIADFVLREGVGITVRSLIEIEEKLSALSRDDYEIMHRNAIRISARLREGYYTKHALSEALKGMGK